MSSETRRKSTRQPVPNKMYSQDMNEFKNVNLWSYRIITKKIRKRRRAIIHSKQVLEKRATHR